jgi:hypothetical protein
MLFESAVLIEAVGDVALRAGVESRCFGYTGVLVARSRSWARRLGTVDRFIWDYTRSPNRSFAE